MTETILQVAELRSPLLTPFSFELAAGEVLAVHGPSGSGKTLLMRALADLDPGDGEVYLRGRERASFTGPEWRRRVGMLQAEPGWWSDRVLDHFPGEAAPANLAGDLETVGLRMETLERPVRQLSTGERQRLALLRLLALAPDVLILDEPTSSLDPDATAAVEGLVRATVDANSSCVVWTTHDRSQRDRVATRSLGLRSGAEA